MPGTLTKTSAPAAKFFPGKSPPHSGGGKPAECKTAVRLTGKIPEKYRSKIKAAEPAPKAPGHSTRSRTETALTAGKTKAEEK